MTSIKLFFADECRRIPHAPPTIIQLREKIKELFGVENPLIQYKDEEDDLITIQTQEEYTEPLTSTRGPLKLYISQVVNFASILASVPLCSSDAGHESEEDIELLESGSAEVDAAVPNAVEKSIETAEIEYQEVGNSVIVPQTSEQASNTSLVTEEKGIITTDFQMIDESCCSKVETAESGCDAKKFSSQNIETVPFQIESVESETVAIPMIENSSNTAELQMKEAGVGPRKGGEIGVQSIEAMPGLLESLRSIIREEIGSLDKLKLSGLQVVHQVECRICHTKPIVGIRYKCQECGFSLCEVCEDSFDHEHPMYKMKKAEEAAIKLPPPPPPVFNLPHLLPNIEKEPAKKVIEPPKPIPAIPAPIKYPDIEPIKPQNPIEEINRVNKMSERFQKAKQLEDLGFKDAKKNLRALEKASYNLDQAVEILLEE
ncbi:unnamed protein product [Blepharisma stoltei]|uniref:UBA domain-containing protein n=1 Tax=Blepharisma stoltei TaxID=1481888 RepID=A0AAU9JTL8_9CILI|nr:unnamed protein product [Blepharisma stoltei]